MVFKYFFFAFWTSIIVKSFKLRIQFFLFLFFFCVNHFTNFTLSLFKLFLQILEIFNFRFSIFNVIWEAHSTWILKKFFQSINTFFFFGWSTITKWYQWNRLCIGRCLSWLIGFSNWCSCCSFQCFVHCVETWMRLNNLTISAFSFKARMWLDDFSWSRSDERFEWFDLSF